MPTPSNFIEKWITKELIRHPATVFFGAVIGAGAIGVSANPFVLAVEYTDFRMEVSQKILSLGSDVNSVAEQVEQMDTQLCELRLSTQVSALEQQISSTESEVYQLERLESSGEALPRDTQRLDNLRTRYGKLKRSLRDVKDRGCKQ